MPVFLSPRLPSVFYHRKLGQQPSLLILHAQTQKVDENNSKFGRNRLRHPHLAAASRANTCTCNKTIKRSADHYRNQVRPSYLQAICKYSFLRETGYRSSISCQITYMWTHKQSECRWKLHLGVLYKMKTWSNTTLLCVNNVDVVCHDQVFFANQWWFIRNYTIFAQ